MAAPDGGWGWVAVGASFIMYLVLGGIERSFGVWYVEILDRYEESSALSEWLIGIHCALRLMTYPLVTMLYTRMSLRVMGVIGSVIFSTCIFVSAYAETFLMLLITFGIIGGCAASLIQYPSTVVIVEYFEKRKTLAFGIASSGSGLGGLILSPLLSYFFGNFSYFETITILAGISLQSMVACTLCFPAYEVESNDEERLTLLEYGPHKKNFPRNISYTKSYYRQIRKAQGRRLFELDLLYNPIMLLYVFGSIAGTMGTFSVLQLVVHFAVTRGETLESASLLLSGTGFIEALSRAFGGVIFNISFLKRAVVSVWNTCAAMVGLCCLLITICYSFWEFLPVVLLSAGSYSLINGFSALVFTNVFEKDAFGAAFSIYSNANGIGILCGTFLAGYLKDVSGSYVQSYYIMAVFCFTSSILFWIAHLLVMRARKSNSYRVYVSLKG